MQRKALLIGCYALLVLGGGWMGYVLAHSLPSLIASSLFASALFICTAYVWKGHLTAYHIATALIFSLFLFFAYRFFLSYKLAPAGVMSLISGALFIYLAATRKTLSPPA